MERYDEPTEEEAERLEAPPVFDALDHPKAAATPPAASLSEMLASGFWSCWMDGADVDGCPRLWSCMPLSIPVLPGKT